VDDQLAAKAVKVIAQSRETVAWRRYRDSRRVPGRSFSWPVSRARRLEVLERDGRRCVWCDSPHDLHVDHVLAQSTGGASLSVNLQTLCRSCNLWKRDRPVELRWLRCDEEPEWWSAVDDPPPTEVPRLIAVRL
jgi:5-methylcytosine-specific restriction endonuclease McrA